MFDPFDRPSLSLLAWFSFKFLPSHPACLLFRHCDHEREHESRCLEERERYETRKRRAKEKEREEEGEGRPCTSSTPDSFLTQDASGQLARNCVSRGRFAFDSSPRYRLYDTSTSIPNTRHAISLMPLAFWPNLGCDQRLRSTWLR